MGREDISILPSGGKETGAMGTVEDLPDRRMATLYLKYLHQVTLVSHCDIGRFCMTPTLPAVARRSTFNHVFVIEICV